MVQDLPTMQYYVIMKSFLIQTFSEFSEFLQILLVNYLISSIFLLPCMKSFYNFSVFFLPSFYFIWHKDTLYLSIERCVCNPYLAPPWLWKCQTFQPITIITCRLTLSFIVRYSGTGTNSVENHINSIYRKALSYVL